MELWSHGDAFIVANEPLPDLQVRLEVERSQLHLFGSPVELLALSSHSVGICVNERQGREK